LEKQLDPEVAHLTIGERESITNPVMGQYVNELKGFSKYAAVSTVTEIADSELDQKLIGYMERLLLDGVHPAHGSKLLAAVLLVRPEVGKGAKPGIPRAWRSLKGWLKITPPRSRLPAPFPIWCSVMNGFVARTRVDLAVFTLMSVDTYARPGQLLKVRSPCLHPPSPACAFWAIQLDPEFLDVPSKTGEYDTTVELDAPHWKELVPILEQLRRMPGDRPMWNFTYPELYREFVSVTTDLRLRLVLCQTRHSGASIDATTKRRTRAEIQKRGGWRSAKSVNRYEKSGRLSQVWHALDAQQRAHALRCEDNLIRILVHGQAVSG